MESIDIVVLANAFTIRCCACQEYRPYFAGEPIVDQIFTVLLSTSMFVGGMVGLILDNTLPGK